MDNSLLIYVTVVVNIFMVLAIFIVLLYAFFLHHEHSAVRDARIELEEELIKVCKHRAFDYDVRDMVGSPKVFDQERD